MGLITYALLTAAAWYASYRLAVAGVKGTLQEKREKYAKRSRFSTETDPDAEPYPWGGFLLMIVAPAVLGMLFAIPFAVFWKFTWFLGALIALYAFVPSVKSFVHRTWDRLVAKKASFEAKLRG